MSFSHTLMPSDAGMVRIYLKPRDKVSGVRTKAFWGAPLLYRALVLAAKKAGIMNAVAHHTHYGYSNHGRLQQQDSELGNPALTMCVELIGPRAQLEAFCREHGALLHDKVIVYKHLEHWAVGKKGEGLVEAVFSADENDPEIAQAS